jgi:peptidoglycan/xylan/chitin deacetylase (PgdA/CDA1 family)
MRWDIWSQIEPALIHYNIKPILAIVPDNQDPVLQASPPAPDFWERARKWQQLGWTIAMHGYQHLYVAKDGGLVATRKKSEFASLPASVQEEKLRRGSEIFAREGIKSRVWIAPGNAFDEITVSLLPRFGIDTISASWFWGPFVGPYNTTWIPCQLSILRPVPAGLWTVCYHPNPWSDVDLGDFFRGLELYHDQIVAFDEALSLCPPNRGRWCYHFCTSVRLSSFIVRVHLKLWKMRYPEKPQNNLTHSSENQSWSSHAPIVRSGQVR